MKQDLLKRHDRIEINPGKMVGKPCIKGTRITVELLLDELGSGWTIDDVVKAHPHIGPGDVRAAQAFAADVLAAWNRLEVAEEAAV